MKTPKEQVFQYLDDLRESGEANMFGAAPYVADEFRLPITEARALLSEWMATFEQRHSPTQITGKE